MFTIKIPFLDRFYANTAVCEEEETKSLFLSLILLEIIELLDLGKIDNSKLFFCCNIQRFLHKSRSLSINFLKKINIKLSRFPVLQMAFQKCFHENLHLLTVPFSN